MFLFILTTILHLEVIAPSGSCKKVRKIGGVQLHDVQTVQQIIHIIFFKSAQSLLEDIGPKQGKKNTIIYSKYSSGSIWHQFKLRVSNKLAWDVT